MFSLTQVLNLFIFIDFFILLGSHDNLDIGGDLTEMTLDESSNKVLLKQEAQSMRIQEINRF